MASDAYELALSYRLRLAQAYEKEDLMGKALEQYRVVLEIDPKNAGAQKKIEELR